MRKGVKLDPEPEGWRAGLRARGEMGAVGGRLGRRGGEDIEMGVGGQGICGGRVAGRGGCRSSIVRETQDVPDSTRMKMFVLDRQLHKWQ